MKRLIYIDLKELDAGRDGREVRCSFRLVGDRVVVEPASALDQPHIARLVVGERLVGPADGRVYYDSLEYCLQGSFYFVEDVPEP